MNTHKKILILGGTGMIGGYLTEYLRANYSENGVVSTYCNSRPTFDAIHFDLQTDNVDQLIESVNPDIVFNLLPGYDDQTLATNRQLLSVISERKARYVFMSTSLVFSDLTHSHNEDDPTGGNGLYGTFKASCEKETAEALENYVILRIAATHGATDGSSSRTTRFLDRLMKGETIEVDAGVIQNRLWTGDLAHMAAKVAESDITGPCHLGPVNASAEPEFLSRLAEAFGYDSSLVVPSASEVRNLTVKPKKILSLPVPLRISEEETIQHIRDDRRLSSFNVSG